MANHISKSFPEVMTPDLWENKQVWFYVQGSPRLGHPSRALIRPCGRQGLQEVARPPSALEDCL